MKHEVCQICASGTLTNQQIEEKLNQGWEPIGVVVNWVNQVIMYFKRKKIS